MTDTDRPSGVSGGMGTMSGAAPRPANMRHNVGLCFSNGAHAAATGLAIHVDADAIPYGRAWQAGYDALTKYMQEWKDVGNN